MAPPSNSGDYDGNLTREVHVPRYLLIESRDPFDSNDTRFCGDLARQLAAAKNEVTLFLVQNGVLPARPGARSGDLTSLAGAGVRVLADSFSLKERGIDEKRLASGVAAAPLDVVLDALAEGAKVIWH
jgi:intracellular sulfur oxidation DsrE/DsrF family protein